MSAAGELANDAARLMPAGAIYHNMDEQDVRRVMRYPVTMIGSDGLPNDPDAASAPVGRLPRVLGHYSRDEQLFPADYRGTQDDRAVGGALPAGGSRAGENWLLWPGPVPFDPQTVRDVASFLRTSKPDRRTALRR